MPLVRCPVAAITAAVLRCDTALVWHLTIGQEEPGACPHVRSWSQNTQKADSEFRISLLTCVGTAGFEPATP